MDGDVMSKLIELGRVQEKNAQLERRLECAIERTDELLEREYDRTRRNIIDVHERTEDYREATALREELDSLGKAHRSLKSQYARVSEMCSALQNAVAEKNDQIGEMSDRMDRLGRENHDLQAALTISDNMVSAQSNTMAGMQAEIDRLREASGDGDTVRIPIAPAAGDGERPSSNGGTGEGRGES